jgi:hypothetical protein
LKTFLFKRSYPNSWINLMKPDFCASLDGHFLEL